MSDRQADVSLAVGPAPHWTSLPVSRGPCCARAVARASACWSRRAQIIGVTAPRGVEPDTVGLPKRARAGRLCDVLETEVSNGGDGRKTAGWILVVIGGLLVVGGIVKASIIGFYDSELPVLLGVLGAGMALVWVGGKLAKD